MAETAAKTGLPETPWDIWMRMGTIWAEHMGDIGNEVMHFVAGRIREDVEAQRRMMDCADPQALAHAQAEFLQKAIDQYTAETGRIVELSGDMLEAMGLPRTDPS